MNEFVDHIIREKKSGCNKNRVHMRTRVNENARNINNASNYLVTSLNCFHIEKSRPSVIRFRNGQI